MYSLSSLYAFRSFEFFEGVKDLFEPSDYKLVKAENVYDALPFLDEGKSLLLSGKVDEAIEQFLMVPPTSEWFEDARCEASFCYYFKSESTQNQYLL